MVEGAWHPVRVADVDLLMQQSPEPADGIAGPVLVLIRLHTRAVGVAELNLGVGETVEDHHEHLRSVFRDQLDAHRQRYGCETRGDSPVAIDEAPCFARRRRLLADAPAASVIVATHDRPDLLARCLDSLLMQQHRPLEIIVVDNARSSDTTERLVRSDRFAARGVRYVREDVPGLGRAHNSAVAHAAGDVLAITDDDVVVDRHWVAALLEAFVEQDAGCVSGLILPFELRTREQSWVEQYGGFARGFERRAFALASPPKDDPLFPFTAGRFGSGANMAFTRDCLDRLGGFDPALGAGTRARGGDDLAAFARTLLAGYRLVYQPDAVVWHPHHDTYPALQRMAHGYGVGLGAYLTSLVWTEPRLLSDLVRRLPSGVMHMTSRRSAKNRNLRADYPRRLVTSERLGLLAGPVNYLASRREASRVHTPGPARHEEAGNPSSSTGRTV